MLAVPEPDAAITPHIADRARQCDSPSGSAGFTRSVRRERPGFSLLPSRKTVVRSVFRVDAIGAWLRRGNPEVIRDSPCPNVGILRRSALAGMHSRTRLECIAVLSIEPWGKT